MARSGFRFLMLTAMPSWLISLVVHFIMFLVLVYWFLPPSGKQDRTLTINDTSDAEEIEELVMEEFEPIEEQTLEFDKPPEQMEDAVISEEDIVSDFQDDMAATMQIDLADFAEETAPFSDLMSEMSGIDGNATSGRGKASRSQLVREGGGNAASEKAVVYGIKWITDHQLKDGSWNFDHRKGAKTPKSEDWGEMDEAKRGATAMALLPYLGSGITHKEGKYKDNVRRGLTALVNMIQVRGDTGSFHESGGRMYSHGLASIALCEAYAMTQDPGLMQPAQYSLNYIMSAQDPVNGGWRYVPRDPKGDTSVVGWQVMALKSGHMGYLDVRKNSIAGAVKFLDTVQTDGGAGYRYTYDNPSAKPSMTSVGLLCRMYLGWKRENPALAKGVKALAKKGPETNKGKANMYYNYYATQVMRQYGGEEWETWNKKMRDFLIQTQVPQDKNEAGSWHFDGPHTEKGGRLYNTSLSLLTLEVYYRHLPIYKQAASEEEFPL